MPPELVWKAWTTPEHLKKWFTPVPWTTVDCEIDLRPGGTFRTVMRSPEGQDSPHVGCYLEIVPNRKLSWTSVLGPGFRPSVFASEGCAELAFTATILLEPQGKGTRYTAIAMHADEQTSKKHADMGFHDGWGKVLEQLVEVAKKF